MKGTAMTPDEEEAAESRTNESLERLRGEEVSHDEVIRLWALSEAVKSFTNGVTVEGCLLRAEKFETYLRTGEAS